MNRQFLSMTVIFLAVCAAASTCRAQRGARTISSVGSGVRVGGSSSLGGFAPKSAGASSYGNLYQAPQSGGALSSSIQQINQNQSRAGRSRVPASAFGGGTSIKVGGSSTKNIAAGALRSTSLDKAPSFSPTAGHPASLLPGAGVAPSSTDTLNTAQFTDETAFLGDSPIAAESSGRAYAAIFAPSQSSREENDKDAEPLKTLVPVSGGSRRYCQLIREGEKAFRKQDYKKASQAFGIAREISSGSSESLLSLMHVHFATAKNRYNMPSLYLQRVLRDVPELPLIPVHPRDFYGNVGTFVEDVIRLEEYVKIKPKDANAQLVLAYMKWREKQPNHAAAALRQAMENSKNNEELIDAIQTFWKAMVYSGDVKGNLETIPTEGETALPPAISPTTEDPLLPTE